MTKIGDWEPRQVMLRLEVANAVVTKATVKFPVI